MLGWVGKVLWGELGKRILWVELGNLFFWVKLGKLSGLNWETLGKVPKTCSRGRTEVRSQRGPAGPRGEESSVWVELGSFFWLSWESVFGGVGKVCWVELGKFCGLSWGIFFG